MTSVAMTVNVEKNVLDEFKETAFGLFGRRKGSLGKAVSEAFQDWLQEKKSKDAARRALEVINKDYCLKIGKFNRQEAHVR